MELHLDEIEKWAVCPECGHEHVDTYKAANVGNADYQLLCGKCGNMDPIAVEVQDGE